MPSLFEESSMYRCGQQYLRLGKLLTNPETTLADMVGFGLDMGLKVRFVLTEDPSAEGHHAEP